MNSAGGIERTGEVLRVVGGVTMANVESLLEQGRLALQDGAPAIVDLAGVTEVDSSSVSLLLQWTRAANARGQRLALANMPENLRSLAVLYGVDDLLPPEQAKAQRAAKGA